MFNRDGASPEGYVYVGDVLSSNADDREYSYIQLENGLQALVVHDTDAVIAGAAMDVSVGSWADPDAYLGLAHAVEHCLFLGEFASSATPLSVPSCHMRGTNLDYNVNDFEIYVCRH